MTRLFVVVGLAMVVCLSAHSVSADTFTFSTPTGAQTNDGPVSATAQLSVTGNVLSVTITNNINGIHSIGQAVSDFYFQVSGQTGNAVLTGSSGTHVFVDANGVASGSSTHATDWGLGNNFNGPNGPGIEVSGIGQVGITGNPAGLILGHVSTGIDGANGSTYANANSSIAGNDPHNPFVADRANFTVTIPGLTSVSQIHNFTFSFGTTSGVYVATVPIGTVPEPTSMILLGSGFLGLATWRRRSRANN